MENLSPPSALLDLDRRIALLVDCPTCEADPLQVCWDADGSTTVPIHEERVALTRERMSDTDFKAYDARGQVVDVDVDPPGMCGAVMVGSGPDSYDPICELPSGHAGPCKSRAAIDQHRIA